MAREILLIRHPSVNYDLNLLEQAENEGRDIEYYLEPDDRGQIMVEKLLDFLPEIVNFSQRGCPIISSDLRRCYIPAIEAASRFDGSLIADRNFAEVPLRTDKNTMLSYVERAREADMPDAYCMNYWFKEPDALSKFKSEEERVKKAMDKLVKIDKNVVLVFTHRLFITLFYCMALGLQDSIEILLEKGRQVANTSITRFIFHTDWVCSTFAKTSHLKDSPDLVSGIF